MRVAHPVFIPIERAVEGQRAAVETHDPEQQTEQPATEVFAIGAGEADRE